MRKVKENERFIPLKNYFLAIGLVVAAVLLTLYGFAWYNVLKEGKVAQSYLVKEKVISSEIQNLDEVEAIFAEVPDEYFIYVSYTGSEEVYNMEKDLKKVINKYELNDQFYYLNVTSIKDNKDYLDSINKSLNLDENIKQVPTIIYVKEGKVVDIIERSDDNMMNVGDFQKLLDIFYVTK
jgi:hypothetical protein